MSEVKIKKRWICAAAGFVMQVFLGLIYAWSVFAAPLEEYFSWDRSQTSVTFSISLACFCVGVILAGILFKKISARKVMWFCAAFILLGFVCTSRINTLSGLYLFYGVLCGTGVGAGYNAVLSVVLPWFPGRQGALSGVLLMGFGFGGSILGSSAALLTDSFGWRNAFVVLGISMGIIIVLLSLLMRSPTQSESPQKSASSNSEGHDYTPKEMAKTSSFKLYYLWSGLLGAAGLTIIGHAIPIAQSVTDARTLAVTVGGLVSIANGIGRLSFGFFLDKAGTKATIRLITVGALAAGFVLLIAVRIESIVILAIGYMICGLSFGGITPTNSAYTSLVFGSKHYSVNLSVVNTLAIASAFAGPSVAGILQSSSGRYVSTMYMFIIYCTMGIPAALFIKMHSKK